MQIQPIVIGTAGHIDHGKSTLVKTLTGIDPDRLKEEQERGMTIDIGFARFQLPDGRTVGIVDVPGHERFVKNMVAGASGIDLVVLVVAADDGVMPQTREHLAIMTLLGMTRGLVALTKIDMVDATMVELARDDIRAVTAGTFLEDAPILALSSITGDGLDEFKKVLFRMASETKPRAEAGVFRMPIQRVFSAHGFGTIVTGIPMSGSIKVGDVVEILPKGQKGKVRGLQAYAETVDRVRAGHSSALNLADVDHHEVTRGMVVATPGFYRPATMVGVQFQAIASLDRPVEDRMPIRLHVGTAEVVGEIVLLDCDSVQPGATALAQLRLEEPVVTAPGDRFVLRLASPAWTLGGGVILEESKHRLKKMKKFVVDELNRQAQSLATPRELLEVVLARSQGLQTPESLSVEIKRSRDETERFLNDLKGQGKTTKVGLLGKWMHVERLALASKRVEDALAAWFEGHALREVVDVRELRRITQYEPEFLQALLEELASRGKLALESGGLVRPKGRSNDLDPAVAAAANALKAELALARYAPPSPSELAARTGQPEKSLRAVIDLLCDRGELHTIQKGEIYLAHDLYEAAKAAIVRNCEKNKHLEIPELRDELQTTRKYLIPFLEHFDTAGLTIRQGANRVLKRR